MTFFNKLVFFIVALLCLSSFLSSGVALVLGLLISLILGNPYPDRTVHFARKLLPLSVVGLGAGMNLEVVAKAGLQGFGSTIITISLTLLIGFILGHLFKVGRVLSLLISVGTAICGGSAIVAVSPVVGAKDEEVTVSLGVVFLLNSLALFIFPSIGHYFHLTQSQFGLWSALAIHDTSSVVGSTMQFGTTALQVGTTVKLARALWIVPLTWIISMIGPSFFKQKSDDRGKAKKKYPWFILGFIIMSAFVTWIPSVARVGDSLFLLSKNFLVFTLFLIGINITKKNIQGIGLSPLFLGVSLWFMIAGGTLLSIHFKILN